MGPEGYNAVKEALGTDGKEVFVSPNPTEGEDVRFVQVGPTSSTDTLNCLTEAGLMERNRPSDAFGSSLPAFRVLSIEKGLVYLEDTNSRKY